MANGRWRNWPVSQHADAKTSHTVYTLQVRESFSLRTDYAECRSPVNHYYENNTKYFLTPCAASGSMAKVNARKPLISARPMHLAKSRRIPSVVHSPSGWAV